MKRVKKIFIPFLIMLLLLPTIAFGEGNAETEVNHVRVPITLVPTENNDVQTAAGVISGYIDFWTNVTADDVEAKWTVTITTPKTYIINVNLNVAWGAWWA